MMRRIPRISRFDVTRDRAPEVMVQVIAVQHDARFGDDAILVPPLDRLGPKRAVHERER